MQGKGLSSQTVNQHLDLSTAESGVGQDTGTRWDADEPMYFGQPEFPDLVPRHDGTGRQAHAVQRVSHVML